MDTSVNPLFNPPQQSHGIAETILSSIHCFSPPVLLIVFLTAFILRSIYASSPSNDNSNAQNGHKQLYGPGGKPLPQRRLTGLKRKQDKEKDFSPQRKLLFQGLSISATLTFLASAAVVLIHVFASSREYWCGQALVVSKRGPKPALLTCAVATKEALFLINFADLYRGLLFRVRSSQPFPRRRKTLSNQCSADDMGSRLDLRGDAIGCVSHRQ